MTATPPSGRKPDGSGVGAKRTMRSTPGTFSLADESTETTVPPYTGGRAMTATFIPSCRRSMPYCARPVVMSKRSTIGISFPR